MPRVLNGFAEGVEGDHGAAEFVGEVFGCFSCLFGCGVETITCKSVRTWSK